MNLMNLIADFCLGIAVALLVLLHINQESEITNLRQTVNILSAVKTPAPAQDDKVLLTMIENQRKDIDSLWEKVRRGEALQKEGK